jgi:RNA polymerase sigma-70 factor, ECF subfamily
VNVTAGVVDPVEVSRGFEEFFAAEYRSLLTLATALCGSRVLGEDVVQDAMFAASRQWPKLSNYDDPARWARSVVIRRSSNVRRGRMREARALERVAGRRDTTTTRLPNLEQDAFWAAVRALPRRQRACIALHYLDDLDVDEIAGILGIASSTVRVHLHAARQALAVALGENEQDAES